MSRSARTSAGRGCFVALLLLSSAGTASGQDRPCNLPEAGTLQAGAGASSTARIRLSSAASTDDGYYTGAKIQITGGTGVGASSVITAYCGQTHSTCMGPESTGTLTGVSYAATLLPTTLGKEVARTLKVTLPPNDSGGKAITAGASGIAVCSSSTSPSTGTPYMTDYRTAPDCTGSMKGLNIYITSGPGAGSVGLIRAGPDDTRQVIVTGLFGICSNTAPNPTIVNPTGVAGAPGAGYNTPSSVEDHNAKACLGNFDRDRDPNCKANLGSPCILKSDCTGNPDNLECSAPVVASQSTYTIKQVGEGMTNCDPLCNGIASFTATVDFSLATDATSTYSIQQGCYDNRFAQGIRRLGSSGSGAGMQNIHLDWKTLIPNGEVVASPAVYSNGDVVVASLRGALTKLSPSGVKYWSIYVGSVIGSPALGKDGTIYFGSGDRNIWAVTPNGITRWRYTTPMPVHGSPLVTDNAVYIGDRNGTFYRFNLDGSVAWKFHSNGEILGGSAMTRDGRIVFGSQDMNLYCVNSTTGALIFATTVGQEIVGTPLIQDVSIVFGTREDNDNYGQVVCLKMDGSIRWTYMVTSSIESQPAEGPNGEVFVATVDGKIFAIQADGQLLWKYNTGGSGGVCKQATYSTESLSVNAGDTNSLDGSSVTLMATNPSDAPRYYRSGGSSGSLDGYYTGDRATFIIGSGVLRNGGFTAIPSLTMTFAPTLATHDTYFTDGSSQNTAIVFQFTAEDRMMPGEEVSIVLPGFVTVGTDTAEGLWPQDAATPAGRYAFSGVSGTLDCATGCSTILVKLPSTGSCVSNDACLGSTITFVSGKGAGQTAVIVDYVHSSPNFLATITYVPIVADATTTYTISPAVLPKFTATYKFATPTATLTLTVPFTDGTTACTATSNPCTKNYVKFAIAATGIFTATNNVLNGYLVMITGGQGAGQTSPCITYYGTGTKEFGCDVETLEFIPDQTSTFRVGPMVETGEVTTMVIPADQNLAHPHYSGTAQAGGSTTTIILAEAAAVADGFYAGMAIVIRRSGTTTITAAVASIHNTTVTIAALPSAMKIAAGTVLSIGTELMSVVSVDEGTKTLTVQRGLYGTTRSTAANSALVYILEFRSITAYTGSTKTATIATLISAPASGDFYRITGDGPTWDFGMTANPADFTVSPPPYVARFVVPTTFSSKQGKVTLADESSRADGNYVGATLVITDGPGKGLTGEITGYSKTTGVALVRWALDSCGGPNFCTPMGDLDPGTCRTWSTPRTVCSAWVRKASHYEIRVVGTVTAYVASSRTLALTQLPGSGTFSIPSTASYCSAFNNAQLMWSCSTYFYAKTPVNLEWASGGWCGAGGGTGWGATSPCVSNGLVVTTAANKFVYGLGLDGVVKFKYMTGKRIKSAPRCVANADKSVTIYTGSNDHYIYKLTTDAQKVLRGTSWYSQ